MSFFPHSTPSSSRDETPFSALHHHLWSEGGQSDAFLKTSPSHTDQTPGNTRERASLLHSRPGPPARAPEPSSAGHSPPRPGSTGSCPRLPSLQSRCLWLASGLSGGQDPFPGLRQPARKAQSSGKPFPPRHGFTPRILRTRGRRMGTRRQRTKRLCARSLPARGTRGWSGPRQEPPWCLRGSALVPTEPGPALSPPPARPLPERGWGLGGRVPAL